MKIEVTDKAYIRSINKALQYIDDHLEDDLPLSTIAEAAHYSPFHFHRIFKAVTNETLNNYINRKRIERAASILFWRKEIPVSEVSLRYGFGSNSSFTRAFKKYYGVNPSEFRLMNAESFSKIGQEERKIGQVPRLFEKYICTIEHLKNWIKMNAKIEVKDVSPMEIAYITHIGDPDNIVNAYDRLIKWANPKNLLNKDTRMITIYHDNLKITDHEKVRMSAGMILEKPIKSEDEVAATQLPQQKCIVAKMTIPMNELEKSWNALFVWMNENGYTYADKPPFEIYYNDFREHPENKCILELFIPVK